MGKYTQTSKYTTPQSFIQERRIMKIFFLLAFFPPSLIAVTPSGGCGAPLPTIPHPGHSHNHPILVEDPVKGSVYRNYRLHLPMHWPRENDVPLPLLLDFHGWTGNAMGHESDGHNFYQVADEDMEGGFLLVTPKGAGSVNGSEHGWGSWNISKTQGPLGDVCETNRLLSLTAKLNSTTKLKS